MRDPPRYSLTILILNLLQSSSGYLRNPDIFIFLLGWSCLLRLVNNINYMYYYLCWCTRFYIIYLVYTMQEYNIFLHTRITCLNFIIYNSIFKTKNSLGYYNENCLNRQNVFRRSFIFIKFLNIGLGSVWNSMYSHMNHFKEEI